MQKNVIPEKRQALVDLFRSKKLSLSFAESCTGGKLSALITEISGVSDIYMGSVVSYSNEVKVNLLGVSRDTLVSEGAVSESIARQMAQGVRNQLKTDWAVAITGIAGPTGGTPTKPVGLVCFAVAGPDFVSADKKQFYGTRIEVQTQACVFAMEMLIGAVQSENSI